MFITLRLGSHPSWLKKALTPFIVKLFFLLYCSPNCFSPGFNSTAFPQCPKLEITHNVLGVDTQWFYLIIKAMHIYLKKSKMQVQKCVSSFALPLPRNVNNFRPS